MSSLVATHWRRGIVIALSTIISLMQPSAHADQPDKTYSDEQFRAQLKDRLGGLLVDFAGSGLQRAGATALSLEAGGKTARARLDHTFRRGLFSDTRHLDFRLSGPVDVDAETQEGDTSVFGEATVLEGAFTLVSWNPGSKEQIGADIKICNEYKKLLREDPVACDEKIFEEFSDLLVLPPNIPTDNAEEVRSATANVWKQFYNRTRGDEPLCTKRVVQHVTSTLLPEKLLPPLVEDIPGFCAPIDAPLFIWRIAGAAGYRDVDRLAGENSDQAHARNEYPYAARLSVGWYVNKRMSLTLEGAYERFFPSGEEMQLCSGDPETGPLTCRNVLPGGQSTESGIIALDAAHRVSDFIAYRLVARYRMEDSTTTVEAPLYISMDSFGGEEQTTGGVTIAWDSKRDDATLQFFIGKAFEL